MKDIIFIAVAIGVPLTIVGLSNYATNKQQIEINEQIIRQTNQKLKAAELLLKEEELKQQKDSEHLTQP